jgi:hypothetical protein
MNVTGLSRRSLLVGAACLVAARAGRAHTPYRQWEVYRRKHLLVGTCRADPESYPLGKRLVSILVSGLPESKARVTRAPDQKRLASLLTTEQLELVLFTVDEAVALEDGKAPFTEYGPIRYASCSKWTAMPWSAARHSRPAMRGWSPRRSPNTCPYQTTSWPPKGLPFTRELGHS